MKKFASSLFIALFALAFALPTANAAPPNELTFGDPLIQPSGATVHKVKFGDRIVATATTAPVMLAAKTDKAKSTAAKGKKAKKAKKKPPELGATKK
ncbi:MAG: hypothetical protein Q7R62_00265 [bacterium]|nr:hypothetical protein [bacterium]